MDTCRLPRIRSGLKIRLNGDFAGTTRGQMLLSTGNPRGRRRGYIWRDFLAVNICFTSCTSSCFLLLPARARGDLHSFFITQRASAMLT
jgi:hypothetical protein